MTGALVWAVLLVLVVVLVINRTKPLPVPDGALSSIAGDSRGGLQTDVAAEAGSGTPEQCGNLGNKVLLTFDDWPYGDDPAGRLHQYVNILKLSKPAVGAMFFPIQQFVEQEYPAAPDYLRSKHFWVGNHSWSHPDLSELKTEAQIEQEIRKGTKSNVLRPPYGHLDSRGERIAARLNLRICLWSRGLATGDDTGISADQIRSFVREHVGPGSVVLMHLSTHSLEALPGMIEDIRAKGLELCALPDKPTAVEVPDPLPC
jgi:peptidoglycan/xylan/chitin deacetylase (PgdA/CDA1 family)